MDQPLVIRLHPNAVIHERQDGVWFQSDSPVVFQHPDMSTMSELVAVFLHHLGGGFTTIRKVGYRFLRRQLDGRFVNLLVTYGPPVAATPVRTVEPSLPPETEMAVDNQSPIHNILKVLALPPLMARKVPMICHILHVLGIYYQLAP
ncbi:hypothetical protein PIB30_006746 [Stylosanthes scabra]|uniref:Uncharacterized protein n=1 Tax=Stylosanthes scabra TaxID=79078 RepID=A0ABU6T5G8_9FABA|nr:hypothetical protein [Stylosanthes scabra]